MYPMGQSAPPPQGGGWGQAQGWQQQLQFGQPQPTHGYGMINQHQPPPQASATYGSYHQPFYKNVFETNAWQAMQFSTEQTLQQVFMSYASQRLGGIQGEALCKILNETKNIRDYYGISWSLELCKIMIAMLDRDRNGIMGWNEFSELLKCLVYWYQTFCQYDVNRSKYIEASELHTIISTKYGYKLSQQAMTTLLKRYSTAMDDGKCLIAFDDFVSLSVRLRAYTEAFRARDRQMNRGHETGQYTYSYDDFLQCTMCL
ncbi:sorcin [Lingula anatina]|uniref:Sorcin n=1 Tax=Lingula anatina TaxID=7574 RepID=A0A1S3J2S7_LINAN|nr:sorcin [Lingula anatina]|eukprot:XP_013404159.1 sorcin [Lingula anatina]